MPNILILSDNPLLQADLTNQIETVLPEYKVTTTDDNETVLDIALLDGKKFLEQFMILIWKQDINIFGKLLM